MAMATVTNKWTAALVRGLPADGQRYEVIHGELFVTPAPSWRHQQATAELHGLLRDYLRRSAAGLAMLAPADVEFADNTMVEPDLFVVPLLNGQKPRSWEEAGRLLLAVEILSPSTARADRQVKRRIYQSEGVAEYWIVDVDARLVERWRPEDERPEILTDRLVWQPDPRCDPVEMDLVAFFSEVCGE